MTFHQENVWHCKHSKRARGTTLGVVLRSPSSVAAARLSRSYSTTAQVTGLALFAFANSPSEVPIEIHGAGLPVVTDVC